MPIISTSSSCKIACASAVGTADHDGDISVANKPDGEATLGAPDVRIDARGESEGLDKLDCLRVMGL